MPPQIALCLCFLFVLYIIKTDSENHTNVSRAIWIPTVWMLIGGSRLVSQWMQVSVVSAEDALVEGNIVDKIIFTTLIASGVFILIKRGLSISKLINENTAIIIFFLYGLISILWADLPEVALKRWFKVLGNPIMILVILTEPQPIEAVKLVFRRCCFILVPFSILLIKYFLEIGVSYDPWSGQQYFLGVTDGKNALGRLCLIFGYFLFWELTNSLPMKQLLSKQNRKKTYIDILYFLMIFWLLRRAHSVTAIICLLLGIMVLVGVKLPIVRRNLNFLGVIFFAVAVGYFFLEYTFGITQALLEVMGRNATLTGRTEIWKIVIPMVTNPIIGFGYDSFWMGDRLSKLWAIYWWHPIQAHNGYIEIYLDLGLMGLFLLLTVIVASYKKCKRELQYNLSLGQFKLGLLVIALFYNITEASFGGLSLMYICFLLCAFTIQMHPVGVRYAE